MHKIVDRFINCRLLGLGLNFFSDFRPGLDPVYRVLLELFTSKNVVIFYGGKKIILAPAGIVVIFSQLANQLLRPLSETRAAMSLEIIIAKYKP